VICSNCGQENPAGFRFCGNCGADLQLAPSSREQRKVVSVLFCDVTGSTALGESNDPEALRSLLARYFERMKSIVEAHGGTVEKFIGDAVMAIFGVPQLHEDDALRAVRAAVEMREALPSLGIQARIGVNTGEVVTGTAERLATGDAVNVAARLEQAAQPGEALIGERTFQLVRELVEAQPVAPLSLRGKAEPVAAYRLVSITGTPERRHDVPMVGRATELRRLRDAYAQAVLDSSCQLFTVLGAAGVGKSRLVHEFVDGTDASVARGHCLSYGEGISYFPVTEVLKQLPEVDLDRAARQALSSLLGENAVATSSDEIAWAFRKLLEAIAREKPLIVVFDDLHWGADTFLDLVEHVADLSRGVPLLLMCMARPELLDRRAAWGGGKLNATTILLEPLSGEETDALLDELGGVEAGLRWRIREAAEGNPLYVEEMLALLRESRPGEVVVPPSIQALLAARLDQLDSGERGVLERGAVEGRVFHRGAVQALAPEAEHLTSLLAALVRKELLRPDEPQVQGEDAFRFRHLLIRDAAYEALPKANRADLHERLAKWLREHGADLSELDEIVGYHLEQAIRYRRELGQDIPDALASGTRDHLHAAGRRAWSRGDYVAAANLLDRAARLLDAGEIDLSLEVELIDSLFVVGRGDDAARRAASVAEHADAAGDVIAGMAARIRGAMIPIYSHPEGAANALDALIAQALPVFEAAGNDLALSIAYDAAGSVANVRAQADAALAAYERAAVHARRAGLVNDFGGERAGFRVFGATPFAEVLAWVDDYEQRAPHNPRIAGSRAAALIGLGRLDEARAVISTSQAELTDRGNRWDLASLLGWSGVDLELAAGNPGSAVEAGLDACRMFEDLGDRGLLSTTAGKLALALCEARRLNEADGWAERAAELGAIEDAETQILWRRAKAKVLAHRGEHVEAEQLAREAVAIADTTNALISQADTYADVAEVLALRGRHEDARQALKQALDRYERKGSVLMAERVRRRLAEIPA